MVLPSSIFRAVETELVTYFKDCGIPAEVCSSAPDSLVGVLVHFHNPEDLLDLGMDFAGCLEAVRDVSGVVVDHYNTEVGDGEALLHLYLGKVSEPSSKA